MNHYFIIIIAIDLRFIYSLNIPFFKRQQYQYLEPLFEKIVTIFTLKLKKAQNKVIGRKIRLSLLFVVDN